MNRIETLDELKTVDRQVIRQYVAWLMGQDIARPSVNRKLSALRSFYKFLLREGILEKSPIPVNTHGRRGERSSSARTSCLTSR
jgi:site-specific recombinase XerD